MTLSLKRISAMFLRYLYLHKRSLPRTLEVIFWPVMELLVWGFLVMYLRSFELSTVSTAVVFLINAMIFWDILYRSQQGVTISFVEEIWTQNVINLLVSPLKIWEWIASTFLYGMLKTIVITCVLAILAYFLYAFDLVGSIGLLVIPLVFQLLLFGWAVGMITSGLMIRFGHSAEALIWGVPYLIMPLSAIYYPLDVLPVPLQVISRCIPTTYVFEGMRAIHRTGTMEMNYFVWAMALNLIYFVVASFFFATMYHHAQKTGRLGKLGLD